MGAEVGMVPGQGSSQGSWQLEARKGKEAGPPPDLQGARTLAQEN